MRKRPWWPLLPPLLVVGVLYLFLAFVHWKQETGQASGMVCIVHQWTGIHCPGCGGTRCAQAITSGHWLAAMGYNPLLMIGFIAFMAGSVYLFVRMTILGKPAPSLPNINGWWIWAGVAGIVLFTILRNIPAYPFTLLAP